MMAKVTLSFSSSVADAVATLSPALVLFSVKVEGFVIVTTGGLQVSWDVLNRASSYATREKVSEVSASYEKLEQISRDIDDMARLAQINISESRVQLKTLQSQINASAKVVDFYKLQFDIARRTLLDVLNAERELSTVELAYVNTQNTLRNALLDYLYSQGTLSTWSDLKKPISLNLN